MSSRKRAQEYMQHYMQLLARKSGVQWNDDMTAEINDLVDCIIDAAVEKMREEVEPSEPAAYRHVISADYVLRGY